MAEIQKLEGLLARAKARSSSMLDSHPVSAAGQSSQWFGTPTWSIPR